MNQSKWKCEAREKKDAYPTVTMWYVHKEQQLPPHFFDIFKSKWLHGKLASSLFIPPPQSSIHILDIILFKNLLDHIAGFYRVYYNSFTIVFLFYNHLYFSYMFRQALVTPHSATITKGQKKVKTCIWSFSHTICLLSVHFTYCYRTGRWSYAYSLMFICIPQYVFPSNSFRYQLIPLAWRQTSVSFITPSPDQSGLHGRVLLSLKADTYETLETGCRTVLPLKKYKKQIILLSFHHAYWRFMHKYSFTPHVNKCHFFLIERLIWVDRL